MSSRLLAGESLVLVIDVQERLLPAVPAEPREKVLRNTGILIEAATLLGVRVLASEQYPSGLGPTTPSISSLLERAATTPVAKTTFDAFGEPAFRDAVVHSGAKNAFLVGMETHICVYQTARSCVALGLATFVVADAVASRTKERHRAGLELARSEGARVTVVETILFDWMGRAGTDAFRAVSKLVK